MEIFSEALVICAGTFRAENYSSSSVICGMSLLAAEAGVSGASGPRSSIRGLDGASFDSYGFLKL